MVTTSVADWLARAQGAPEQARAEWAQRGVAVLPLGERFCAVRLREAFVHAAAGSEDPQLVSEVLTGPALRDGYNRHYYILIQPLPKRLWRYGPEAQLLGRGSYLGVPAIDRFGPVGVHWVIPPQRPGDLCSHQNVGAFINAGYATPPVQVRPPTGAVG